MIRVFAEPINNLVKFDLVNGDLCCVWRWIYI